MTQRELHMKELFEWIQANYQFLKKFYKDSIPKKVQSKMPFTMFAIVQYCEYLDVQKITKLKVKEK